MISKLVSWLLIGVGAAALFFSLANAAAAYDVPEYDGFVNDYANIISIETEETLESDLALLASSTGGAEIAVVTVESLNDEPIEMVAQDFFDTWEIGKKETNNGVLVLVALNDRQMRIQTGYGAEAVITDSYAGRIIRNQMTPAFKEERYDEGIVQAVATLTEALQNPDAIPSTETSQDSEFNTAAFMFLIYFVLSFGVSLLSYIAAFFARSKSWWLGGVVGGGLGLLFGNITGGIFFGLLGLFLDYILSKNYKTWKIEHRTTQWRKTMGGFRSSGGSSRSSGFGGGSSGGGGASGSW
jgi:uncharacterized protein